MQQGEPLLDITTEKVDTEVPAPASGVLVEIICKPGDVVSINARLGVIDTEAEGRVASMSPQQRSAAHSRVHEVKPEKKAHPLPVPGAEVMSEEDDEGFFHDREEHPHLFSPLVKTLAVKYGISESELEALAGSGPGGKVTKEDLLKYIESHSGAKTGPATKHEAPHVLRPGPAAPEAPQAEIEWDASGLKTVSMDTMRSAIAEHMVRSKHTSPHVNSIQEVDLSAVAKWRLAHKEEFLKNEGFNLSLTPFFLEAAVQALLRFPYVNSSVEGSNIVLKKHVNLGCAVALGDPGTGAGLVVPVIRNAEEKNLVGLARALHDLAERARDKRLLPDEVSGGSFTVTNPGVFGTLIGTPIINQPQVAILCIGMARKRPVVIDDMLAIREMCYLTLSYDHRVIDGALSGVFLGAIREYLERWDGNRPLYQR